MQDKISAYLNDLISIGVSGFRIDAAKHIPAEDLSEIFAKLSKPVYITMVRHLALAGDVSLILILHRKRLGALVMPCRMYRTRARGKLRAW